MAYVERLVGFHANDPTLERLQRDASVDAASTRSLIDLGRKFCYSGANPALVGSALKDMVYGAPDAVVNTQLAYVTNGLFFAGSLSPVERVALGSNWKIPGNCKHFCFGGWFRLDASYPGAGAGAAIRSVMGLRDSVTGFYQWAIRITVAAPSGAGAPTTFLVAANNRSVQFSLTAGQSPCDGLLHHLQVEYEDDGTNHYTRLYIDGVLYTSSTAQATPGSILQVQAGDVPYLGAVPTGTVGAHRGRVNRINLDRLDLGGPTLAQRLATEMANNASRFPA
jgi:hypothetical protein